MKKIITVLVMLVGLVASCFAMDFVQSKDWGYCIDWEDNDGEYYKVRTFKDGMFSNMYNEYCSLFGTPEFMDVTGEWNERDYYFFQDANKDFFVFFSYKDGQEYIALVGLTLDLERITFMWRL